jgi:sterol desaturase/sphingolipid hydroxylase (fatty acid hydroxylase superfamily)
LHSHQRAAVRGAFDVERRCKLSLCELPLNELFTAWAGIFAMDLARYLLFAGSLFLLVTVLLRGHFRNRKIQRARAELSQIRQEVLFSIATVVIFSLNGLFIHSMTIAGQFEIYDEIERYGWVYWAFSIVLIVVLHDTYFYWLHRLMHLPRVFRLVHLRHHRSRTPTAWTAYSFAPLEALIHAAFLTLFLTVFPLHWSVVLIFINHMLLRNVIGHSGHEIFPKTWLDLPILRWITTVTHHDLHHSRGYMNFGLYFTWWDRLCSTENPLYAQRFRMAAGGARCDAESYSKPASPS